MEMSSSQINIGGTPIGNNHPVYFIGELSVNHQHSIDIALNTMQAIKDAGANAIKLQTYRAESLTLDVDVDDNDDFRIAQNSVWDGQTYYQLFKENAMAWEWHETLYNAAQSMGLQIFSTPFDAAGVQLLQSLDSIAYKIASYEIRHIPLIEQVAKIGKPILISTGIANNEDIQRAIQICHQAGNHDIILMKCTSAYPAKLSTLHLQDIPKLQQQFGTPVGLSDHSYSPNIDELIVPPVVATTLGAAVIEKHVILERSTQMQTADSHFSLTPHELKTTINAVRNAQQAMNMGSAGGAGGVGVVGGAGGSEKGEVWQSDWNGREDAKTGGRSIYAATDIRRGEIITEQNVAIVRPGFSLHPKHYHSIIGKRTSVDLRKGSRIALQNIY